ncbi:MAG: sulfatase-like hydrolase/transferase [bacterium]|nr:sulfatase-like hydrolase/transferase [bacterium]
MNTNKPNILWIMADQLRADCLGFMGNGIVQTPNLDGFAAEGIVFTNAFCQSPACMASRASLFTGRYPSTIKVRGMGILPSSETTFSEFLRRNGYHTACAGKLHFTPEQYTRDVLKSDVPIIDWRRFADDARMVAIPDDPMKENYGFEEYFGCEDILKGNYHRWVEDNYPELFNKEPERFSEEGPGDLFISPYPSEAHHTAFISSQAATFIRKWKDENPWFIFCSFIAPHHPFEAPQDQIERYDVKDIPLPQEKDGIDASFIPEPAKSAVGEMKKYSAEIQRRIILHYYASISLIDDCVGMLIRELKDTGQYKDTIIVFCSDHGEFLGNHGLLRKPSIHYDELIRVPLFIKLPKNNSRKCIDGLVELVDIYPTLLGFLGMPPNPGLQGIDWSGKIVSNDVIGRDDIYSEMYSIKPIFNKLHGPYTATITMRTKKWKLNLYPEAGIQYGQLFNLEEDPDETKNLYRDSSFRTIKEEMLWRLAARYHLMADPLPLWLTQF